MFFVRQGDAVSQLCEIEAGVPQGSVLGPTLYLLFTVDLSLSNDIITATFADDTAILAVNEDPASASLLLQHHLNKLDLWLKKWRIKVNKSKSTHVTFTNRRATCPPVKLNSTQIPQADDVKYLGIHLDRRRNISLQNAIN